VGTSADCLSTTVVNAEVFTLRNGQRVLSVQLDVTYLRLIQHLKPLGEQNRSDRKRRKQKLPAFQSKRLIIRVTAPNGEVVETTGDIALTHPLDAPAVVTLNLHSAESVPVGSRVELLIS
jgi:hypothetical protein